MLILLQNFLQNISASQKWDFFIKLISSSKNMTFTFEETFIQKKRT